MDSRINVEEIDQSILLQRVIFWFDFFTNQNGCDRTSNQHFSFPSAMKSTRHNKRWSVCTNGKLSTLLCFSFAKPWWWKLVGKIHSEEQNSKQGWEFSVVTTSLCYVDEFQVIRCLLKEIKNEFHSFANQGNTHFSTTLAFYTSCWRWIKPILKEVCSQAYPGTQFAFKDLMIHWILQFALHIAFRCVLHRYMTQDIHY